MKIFLYLLSGVAVVLAATWTYQVNYRTQDALNRVTKLQIQIAREHEAISVLRTEWAYLNRPERLRALANAYFMELRLDSIHAGLFGDPSMVPFPVPDVQGGEIIEQIVLRDE